jgi:hypothetical protein
LSDLACAKTKLLPKCSGSLYVGRYSIGCVHSYRRRRSRFWCFVPASQHLPSPHLRCEEGAVPPTQSCCYQRLSWLLKHDPFPNRPVTYSPVNYAALKALTRAHDKEWSVSKAAEPRHPSFIDIICLQLPGITLGLHQSLSVSRKATVSALAGKSSILTLFAPTVSHNTIPSNYAAGPTTTIQHLFSLKRSSIANTLSSRTSKHTGDIFARSKTRISKTAGGDVVT